jgi:methylthioribose-1-phosphate isomerase
MSAIHPIRWTDTGLELLDQRRLPQAVHYLHCPDSSAVAEAIHTMVVRGAPAIGIAAAYGAALAARARYAQHLEHWRDVWSQDCAALLAARPTAVNLAWALTRLQTLAASLSGDPFPALLAEAQAIAAEDLAANRRMGELGAALLPQGARVITHCNTGALATGGWGTALGVIRSAYAQGKLQQVYAGETRPWLQGARLTAWELQQDGIPYQLYADSAAAFLMHQLKPDWVIVGADRIAANGDTANKIGTYALALAARQLGVKFMVVAPCSTLDFNIPDGTAIPIEQRGAEELLQVGGHHVGTPGSAVWNPVFDLTPANLIDALVTERGVAMPPNSANLQALRDPQDE